VTSRREFLLGGAALLATVGSTTDVVARESVAAIGAVYATKSKLLLRMHIPDHDGELDQVHIGPGESMMRVPIEVFRSGNHLVVQDFIGKPTISGVCEVIHKETGEVINRIVADPELYSDPDGHYVVLVDETV